MIIYFSVFVLSFFTVFISFRLACPLKVRIVDHRLPLFLFRLPFRNGAQISFLFGHLFRNSAQISFLFGCLFRNGVQISFRFPFLFGHLNRNGGNIPFRFAFLFPHLVPHLQKVLTRCRDIPSVLVPQGLPAP